MLTLLALLACDPAAVTLDEDLRQARPGQADTDDSGLTDDSGDTGDDSGDSGDSSTDTDDSGNVGWAEVDDDGDGYSEDEGDCDDGDAAISPDAEEVWYDDVNQNCDEYSDYDQDGDGEDSWYVDGGTDCDDDDDGYYAVDCFDNNSRPDCDDRYSNVNPEVHEDNTDGLDNNCNDVTDGLGIEIEWSLTYECANEVCSEYGYGGILSVTITDDFPDMLVLLGGGPINTAEPIGLDSWSEAPASVEYEVGVVTDGTPHSGDETTFGDQASTVSYLYMSGAGHEATNGSRCIVWGPQADVLVAYDEDIECVDITDLVEGLTLDDGVDRYVSQYWDGSYE